jgi:hypothetical protein
MRTSEKVPEAIRGRAIDLAHLGVNQVAWFKKDVFEILGHLDETQVAILGGDVLVLKDGKFTHEYSNWHSDQQPNESQEDYAKRSREETESYINRYPDPEDGSIAYVLVMEQGDSQQISAPYKWNRAFSAIPFDGENDVRTRK